MRILLCSFVVLALLHQALSRQASQFTSILQENTRERAVGSRQLAAEEPEGSAQSRLRAQVSGAEDNDFINFARTQSFSESLIDSISPSSPTRIVTVSSSAFDENGDREPGRRGTASIRSFDAFIRERCVWNNATSQRCDPYTFYRTPSGHCNNLEHKIWGMAGTPFRRVKAATYNDPFGQFRTRNHHSSGNLPNPRTISRTVTSTSVVLDNTRFSAQIMQWGQYIAHEITSIKEESDADCCGNDNDNPWSRGKRAIAEAQRQVDRIQSPWGGGGGGGEPIPNPTFAERVCIPIHVFRDPIFGQTCMNQVRSASSPVEHCLPSPRQQMNTASHFVDGSAIYGSSTSTMNRLRNPTTGELKSQTSMGRELPPQRTNVCPMTPGKCPFDAGDRRINTTPNLVSVHTLFLRKHNKIAAGLQAQNTGWNREKVFQETRRIIIAIEQNIHFNEWIQHILGISILNRYGLRKSSTTGFRNVYNANTHPGLLNEAAGSALRFGHSTVGSKFRMGTGNTFLDLLSSFNKHITVYNSGIGQCLAGLSRDSPWRHDKFFPDAMRDSLFGSKLDIVALNLNRGRDHGFTSYAHYRAHYFGVSITSWADMAATHTADVINQLQSVYADPRDVELFIGAVTEKKLVNGFIGPLNAEILGDAFKRLRNGDRFYFEGSRSGFTKDQINSIRQYSYAKLICENGDVSSIPFDAFRLKSQNNLLMKCDSDDLPDINLDLWKEDYSPPRPDCSWRIVDTGPCCQVRQLVAQQSSRDARVSSLVSSPLGQQTVVRVCEGVGNCYAGGPGCLGSSVITQNCVCDLACRNGRGCDNGTGCGGYGCGGIRRELRVERPRARAA